MRLHSLEYGEKRAQPCPYCVKGGLAYQCENLTDGDTYRCAACLRWMSHCPVDNGTCAVFTLVRRSEKGVRCVPVEIQEALPLG